MKQCHYLLLTVLFLLSGCNNNGEKPYFDENIKIASKKYATCDGESSHLYTYFLYSDNGEKWEVLHTLEGMEYEFGYEYTILGQLDTKRLENGELTRKITVTKVLSKVKKESEGIQTYQVVSKEIPMDTPCDKIADYK